MKAENISMGNMQSGRDREVLAVPPYSCRNLVILVEWNLAEGSANLFIPVLSILVEFRWILEFTQKCSPEWSSLEWTGMVFPGIHLNCLFVCYLFVMNNKQCLVDCSSHHHHQHTWRPQLPTQQMQQHPQQPLRATNNDRPWTKMATNGHNDHKPPPSLGNSRGKSNPWGLWVRVLEGKGRGSRSVTPNPSLYPWLFLVSIIRSPVGWGWGSHWTGEA